MKLRLYVDPDAPLSFVSPTALPADEPDAYPWLIDAGDLIRQARTGQYKGPFSNQSANVTATLDNTGRQASTLLGQPLRAWCEIDDDNGDLYFAGVLQAITYGTTLGLDIGA